MKGSEPIPITLGPARRAGDRPGTDRRLIDAFGRVATDLRVSLTDRCNLRCTYCMPAEGLAWLPRREILTDDEINRLVRIAVERLGIREVRFTGGEPLLRPGLERIIAATAALRPRPDISVTTNGIGLARRAQALADSGLQRINVSLDTLRADRFRSLARRDRIGDVLDGLRSARRAGLRPVKVNAVLMRGVNDDEAVDLLRYCVDNGFELRFIEQMPLGAGWAWRRENMVAAEEILVRLSAEFTLTPTREPRAGAPAERWLVDGGPATVGVIASVTRPFCSACDRTRLTADGQIRSCLFSASETDLRGLLRTGAVDEQIADRWRLAMWGKAAGHGVDTSGFAQPSRSMSTIGG
ncbi:GTP 3',8-cyclase MoaA [Amycolatopsis echigonensis]|uniref:GTP 3',8-cyclase n=1 Tax=Amycolatopsis echigonensis TaxID=2576905 RepID=A0A8E1W8W9_9PSEU|nr:GTP 3',8-cyclase MoaA [Amycolatopsis echigonensis]MBB2505723.1 GTP 3',8-cyclase MoaA [Amycolatopsis echigonensis]